MNENEARTEAWIRLALFYVIQTSIVVNFRRLRNTEQNFGVSKVSPREKVDQWSGCVRHLDNVLTMSTAVEDFSVK